MKAQVNSLTVTESQCEPQELEGRRVTFPVCFSDHCRKHRTGQEYKTNDGQRGAIQQTKQDYCPACKSVLFWVTERRKVQ